MTMGWLSYIIAFTAMALQLTLLLRAWQGHFLGQYRVFYSYILFTACWSAYTFALRKAWPQVYVEVFWFHAVIGALAEFAILVEISDHLFHPFPAIRRLGRLLTLSLIAVLSAYVVPALLQSRSSSVTILDFFKRSSFAKAVIVIALLALARHYDLPPGKNVMGLMLGFLIYLCLELGNFALAQEFGGAAYGRIFAVVGPLGYTLGVAVWTAALWRYEPVVAAVGGSPPDEGNASRSLGRRLKGFNDLLENALRK